MAGERVLAIFAHPDDESFLAGGTLAACAKAGREVILLCLTRGEQGPIASPRIARRATLGTVRAAELEAAGRALGAAVVECLDYPDGGLAGVAPALIQARLVGLIRDWRPAAIITFGPEGFYWHPDHIAVHDFTMAALDVLAAEGFSPPVYFATWPAGRMTELTTAVAARGMPGDLWGLEPEDFGVPAATISTVCDVRRFLPAKLEALRCHRSQFDPRHLLHALPNDLAEEFLGREYFVHALPGSEGVDWLRLALDSQVLCS
jgi:N-acetyl-1-D-myo-inositol-2-amino-2-deoxy-alpha-D-glucopyranoside deacetylase